MICFYFQVHQPRRLKKFSVFDIGKSNGYFDDEKNKEIIEKVSKNCYLPTNRLLLRLIKEYGIKVTFSISGTVLDQLEEFYPEVIKSFRELADTGKAEFLAETYNHSLSYLHSKEEFREQVKKHKDRIKELFGVTPGVFRNTELIYNNSLAKDVEKMGFKGIIAEGTDRILGWRSPNFIYKPEKGDIKVLLKNYKLSDDIAFRFSEKRWGDYPLTAKKFAEWLEGENADLVNLFMDYETFGEHQSKETGILDFLKKLPEETDRFITPSEAIEKFKAKDVFDTEDFISWADTERDLSAWQGNHMQKEAIKELYEIKNQDEEIFTRYRDLQNSDHFYYMCTKRYEDGEVHEYFNPYDTPYEAFISYMNIMNDIKERTGKNTAAREKI
ncbi:MAG: glycoside hydrolase family 57 protein [Nanobdellota archaeon]